MTTIGQARGVRRSGRRGTGVLASWGVCLGFAGVGCDAQVDPAYQGEPLITIDGTVEAPLSVGDVEVGILWFRPANDPFESGTQCTLELSDEVPSACVAACGTPSCDDVPQLEQWSDCASQCEGPDGIETLIIETRFNDIYSGAVGQTTPVAGTFPAQFQLSLLEPPPDDVLGRSRTGERVALGLFVALDPTGAPFELALEELPDFPPWVLGGSASHALVFTPDGVAEGSGWYDLLGLELDAGFQLFAIMGEDFGPVPASAATEVQLTVADPTTIDWPLLPP